MNIDFMRKVDFWVGVPMCAVVSSVRRVGKIFLPKPKIEKVKRVLFIELSEMGSAILADATLKKTAKKYETYFVIFKKNAVSLKLLKPLPFENVFCIREDSFFTLTWDTLRFFWWCRRMKIDAIVDLELFSRYTMLLSSLSGADIRLGYVNPNGEGLYRGDLLTHAVAYNPHIHISMNFIALVEPLFNSSKEEFYIKRRITEEEANIEIARVEESLKARVREKIDKAIPAAYKNSDILLVNANAGDLLPHRRWQKDKFASFILQILKSHPDLLILLTGSPSERASVQEVADKVALDRCVNFAGHVTFEELPAVYALSKAIVTNDSGPAHFASAVGLKTFVLFGPETPRLYGPMKNSVSITAGLACSPCVNANNHRNTACVDNVCMKSISAEFVFAQVDQFLRGTGLTTTEAQILVCR